MCIHIHIHIRIHIRIHIHIHTHIHIHIFQIYIYIYPDSIKLVRVLALLKDFVGTVKFWDSINPAWELGVRRCGTQVIPAEENAAVVTCSRTLLDELII